MKPITYIWHRGSDTFFALDDETYIFFAEDLSEEALESVEEASSMRGFEDEGIYLDDDRIDAIRSSVAY